MVSGGCEVDEGGCDVDEGRLPMAFGAKENHDHRIGLCIVF